LSYEPHALLLDEISASIDPPLAFAIFKALREELVASSRIGLFVTHYVELAKRIADEVIFLSSPTQIVSYTPSQLERSKDLAVEHFLLKA
jgi:ABC-type multidrug transport system ATPase subunit